MNDKCHSLSLKWHCLHGYSLTTKAECPDWLGSVLFCFDSLLKAEIEIFKIKEDEPLPINYYYQILLLLKIVFFLQIYSFLNEYDIKLEDKIGCS